MRLLWTMAGWASFGLGALGAFLPLLPTVPLMLLAAFCFARGSAHFHDWLMNHPTFGPPIHDWYAHGAIRSRSKIAAVVAIGASFGLSIALGVPGHVLWIQGVALTGVAIFILSRPGGEKVRADLSASPLGRDDLS